jgi:hypothetical protein
MGSVNSVEVGGLMSYGTDLAGHASLSRRLYRPHPQGRREARHLPVVQSTKFEFVINP